MSANEPLPKLYPDTDAADQLLQKLDELIALTRAAGLPLANRWLDAAGVGALLSVSRRTALEHYAPLPHFPKPLREGQPRWKASEVLEWADARRAELQPRKRRKVA